MIILEDNHLKNEHKHNNEDYLKNKYDCARLQEVEPDEVPSEDEVGGQEGDENDDDSTGDLEDPMEKKEEVDSFVPNLLFNLV